MNLCISIFSSIYADINSYRKRTISFSVDFCDTLILSYYIIPSSVFSLLYIAIKEEII